MSRSLMRAKPSVPIVARCLDCRSLDALTISLECGTCGSGSVFVTGAHGKLVRLIADPEWIKYAYPAGWRI